MAGQSVISRRMSQSAVIQAIASFGPVSRASVAKIAGLSKQTVSEIVADLESEGWVRAVGRTEGHVGRRAVVYEISPSAATVASVDLGGTKVRVALCDLTGIVLAERVEPTERAGGMNVVEQIARMVHRTVAGHAGSIGDLHIAVVGVPGVPDPGSGGILLAPNIAGIDRIDLAGALGERLGFEVLVENDVNLAALGEHWLGNRGEDDSLAFISIGTGIGAGIVVAGNLLRGSFGAAGEIGFLPFGADPFEAESLKAGALERAAAGGAIVDLYRSLSNRVADVPGVFDAAGRGDAAAKETLDRVARQIARAVTAILAVADPSVVVIGGSIGSRDEILDRIVGFVSECYPRAVEIGKSRLGDHATLAGGASVALSRLHLSVFAEGQKGAAIAVPPPAIENFRALAT